MTQQQILLKCLIGWQVRLNGCCMACGIVVIDDFFYTDIKPGLMTHEKAGFVCIMLKLDGLTQNTARNQTNVLREHRN